MSITQEHNEIIVRYNLSGNWNCETSFSFAHLPDAFLRLHVFAHTATVKAVNCFNTVGNCVIQSYLSGQKMQCCWNGWSISSDRWNNTVPSSSSSTGTLGAAMMSIAIGKGCKIIVNRIVKRMSKPRMDVSKTVVPRKKLQILINGHKPDKWSFWIYYSWRLLSMAFAVAVVFAL